MQSYECVSFPAEQGFIQIARSACERLFVAAPFIGSYGIEMLLKHTSANQIMLLTNLDINSIVNSSLNIVALLKLWDKFDIRLSSLGKLHAKVYIADDKVAMITSANLTYGGLKENYEYGIMLRDEEVVVAILQDMSTYFSLGNIFGRETLENIRIDVEEIQSLHLKLHKGIQTSRLQAAISEKQNAIHEKMLLNRVKDRTINAIFAETIKYLLESRGPLSTQELHPLIQNIHPDICDDTIDRVINGQHFGKKWKHLVRNAQQFLKKKGAIYLQGGKWHICSLM
jgi:hypothetical protein